MSVNPNFNKLLADALERGKEVEKTKRGNMKIDAACIDANALYLIKEEIGLPYEYAGKDDSDRNIMLITLGYIYGVTRLADALKEVLLKNE